MNFVVHSSEEYHLMFIASKMRVLRTYLYHFENQ